MAQIIHFAHYGSIRKICMPGNFQNIGYWKIRKELGRCKAYLDQKRACMLAKKIKKSATIFGASCSQKAKIEQKLK